MGNVLSGGGSNGLLGGLFGDVGGIFNFALHPLDSIMIFVGGIILLVIVFKIIAD